MNIHHTLEAHSWLMLFVVAWVLIVVSVMGVTWWVKRSRRSQPFSTGS